MEICNLPNEVLIKILSFLDNQSIQNATKVCQNWHDLVESTPKIYRKIGLLARCASINALLREFSAIPVTSLKVLTYDNEETRKLFEDFRHKLITFLTRHSATIETAEMYFRDMNLLCSHLRLITRLQDLRLISRASINVVPHTDSNVLVELPHLHTLCLSDATHALRHLQLPQISVLKVIDTDDQATNANLDTFLRNNETLREIKLMGFIPRFSDIGSFRFRLTSLSVLLKGEPETPSSSVLELLASQRDSLRELKIVGFDTRALVEYALSEMPELTCLVVDVSKTRTRIKALKASLSVRQLTVEATAGNVDNLLRIVAACTQLESLHVATDTYRCYNKYLTLASKMPNLKHLHIDSVLLPVLSRAVRFEQLETLTVTDLENEKQIHGFVQLASRCPRLQKATALGFGMPFYSSPTTMSAHDMLFLVIVTAGTLRELELMGRFTLTDEVVDVMLSERCALKKLTFSSYCNDGALMGRVRRLHATGIQCCINHVDEQGRSRVLKRKDSD